MQQIEDGIWRWTGYHEEWRGDVGSIYVETKDGVVLIDPLVPPEDTERFWRALDRDVQRAGGPVRVLVTVFWHTRSAAEMVRRYGARVLAPSSARATVSRRARAVVETFRLGDRLPGGVEAFGTARAGEVVYWIPRHHALVPGDVILGAEGGGVRLCPASWLPSGKGHTELATSLRPLLRLPIERILVSHGEPVLAGGADALAAALRVE